MLIYSLYEELLFRYFIKNNLMKITDHHRIITSLMFGLFHLINYFVIKSSLPIIFQVIFTFVLGMYLHEFDLNTSILIHVLYNLIHSLIFFSFNNYIVNKFKKNYTASLRSIFYVPKRRKSCSNIFKNYSYREKELQIKEVIVNNNYISKINNYRFNKFDFFKFNW